jgi:hypothetical protein
MNTQGIPNMKELWTGIVIDPDAEEANRHLKLAGLAGREVRLEMVEEPLGEDEEDDEDETCPDCGCVIEECDCEDDPDELEGDDEPDEEPCKDYPKGCEKCAAYSCNAEVDEPDDEPMAERLVVRTRKKGAKVWKEMSDATMEKNPALYRFLTQVAEYHGL